MFNIEPLLKEMITVLRDMHSEIIKIRTELNTQSKMMACMRDETTSAKSQKDKNK